MTQMQKEHCFTVTELDAVLAWLAEHDIADYQYVWWTPVGHNRFRAISFGDARLAAAFAKAFNIAGRNEY